MLPSETRLRENSDFRRVYGRGRSWPHPLVVLNVMRRTGPLEKAAPGIRFGFVVSKKQGKAVIRNRIKRRLREAVRLLAGKIRHGAFDVVFVARSPLKNAAWEEILATVEELLRRASLLQNEEKRKNEAD